MIGALLVRLNPSIALIRLTSLLDQVLTLAPLILQVRTTGIQKHQSLLSLDLMAGWRFPVILRRLIQAIKLRLPRCTERRAGLTRFRPIRCRGCQNLSTQNLQ